MFPLKLKKPTIFETSPHPFPLPAGERGSIKYSWIDLITKGPRGLKII
jgi:hypothetical protein